ncbi:ras and EF-hand domain-containing protein-like isoform X2 [Saccopteryx leptura]|uniref:ras and EF-hand domain-containing protein-like isoform X2 n=1 Tax=Saccopteryx leptura TaxID=249018 RepID=UPI00339C07FE
MDADVDQEELARLRSVFAAYDAHRSGRLEREEFSALCAKHRVRPADAEAVFQRLDSDRDGVITFQEFARGCRGARRGGRRRGCEQHGPALSVSRATSDPGESEEDDGHEDAAAAALAVPWGQASPGRGRQDFQARLGDEAKFIPRAQDKAAMQLSELEEEMDQRIQAAEHKTRKDEKCKAEEALSDLRRQYETEVGNLQVTKMKLKKLEEQSKHVSQKEDVAAQKKQIYDLSMENQKVKKDLLEAQKNIAFLQSELDALKSDYADQSLNSVRDLEVMRECMEVRNTLQRQIEKLQTANRKLQDSNDGLRSALENTYSKFDRSSVPDIREEEAYDSEGLASVLDWKPGGSVGEGSVASFSREPILALSPQTAKVDDNKSSSSQKAYKIVFAGDTEVGKSSFLMRLCKNEFQRDISATVGIDFQMKSLLVDEERTVLHLWDMSGVKRFRSIAKSCFRRTDGVLLLYDVTCEESFLSIREWVDMIEDATTESIPIMLVGNKADLLDTAAAEGQKCVPRYCGEKLAMTYGALFCETSAKDGSNIVEAVLHLARFACQSTEV